MLIMKLVAAVAAAFFMAAAGGAQATTDPQHNVAVARHMKDLPATVTVTTERISSLRAYTWGCQKRAGLALSKASQRASALAGSSEAYRAWVAVTWQRHLAACRTVLERTIPWTGDWETAVRVVQRVYPGSAWWLLSCSSSEGGHGPWVPNRSGSGAGGWMQYMEGTFVGDYDSAVQDLAARGVRVPASTASWYSALGQAIAAGWAYGHDRPAGKWTGGSC